MEEIHWIYLVDYTGTPVEIYLKNKKEILRPNQAVISNFLFGIKEINKDLEENIVNKTEINDHYFFFIEEKKKEFFIIMKSEKSLFIEKFLNHILRIKDRFIEIFQMNQILTQERKIKLLKEFKKEVKEYIL